MTRRPAHRTEFFKSDFHKNSVNDMRRAKKIIGKFLYEARYNRGLTPEQLSRKSKVSVKAINQIEMGKGRMEWGIVSRLALALGRPLSHFLWDGE